MDRIITKEEKNKGRFNKIILLVSILACVIFAFKYLKNSIQTKADLDKLVISKVEIGDIQSSFTAQGQIIPEKEVSINAPISTQIEEIFQNIGNTIKKGASIIQLNDEFLRLTYESDGDNLLLKKNNIQKSSYQFDKNITDLSHDSQILDLRIQEQKADLDNLKVLIKMGASTKDDIKKKEITLKITQLEKQKLDNELQFQIKYYKIEKENLALEVRINEKSLKKLKTKLNNTLIKSPIDGVIMWVNKKIGKQVSEGENIARIADLSSFSITGLCSGRYTTQIAIGTKVLFHSNQGKIAGKVVNIEPVVANNQIKFDVQLDNPKQPNLRAYTKGELRIITGSKQQVKRIKRGLGIKGGKKQDVFVIRGDKVIKTPIEIGAANSEYIEIISDQIHEGDEIIVSDMDSYQYKNSIQLNK